MSDFVWKIGFDVDADSIQDIQAELQKVKTIAQQNKITLGISDQTFQEAEKHIQALEAAFTKAFDPKANKINFKTLVTELNSAGVSIGKLRKSFGEVGIDGNKALNQINSKLKYTGLTIKETNKAVAQMMDTLGNTIRWKIASTAVNAIQGSVQRAVGFTKALDESLNNIRIVTGASAEEMDSLARSANETAKALGKTTVEYTDAALIFYQQGKNKTEVEALTKATLIGANITGQEVSETAELLTAALNGYNLEATKAMEIMDKFASVGASTGSDFEEMAKGFSKVASMAKTAGVEVDQLNAMLATISTVTREAPESIGTSLKTIFGRMTEVKAGKEDEDGWNLGRVEQALNKVDMSLLDTTGRMKDMGLVMTEVGSRWKEFNQETQFALSIAMAGNRQQNRLIALFNNWEMYQDALQQSTDAEGTAVEQNLVRMDSISYKAKQLKAELEELWMKIIDSDSLKRITDMMTSFTSYINDAVDAFGGMDGLLKKIGIILGGIFSTTFLAIVTKLKDSVVDLWHKMTNYATLKKSIENKDYAKNEILINKMLGEEKQKQYKNLINTLEETQTKLATEQAILEVKKLQTQESINNYNTLIKENEALATNLRTLEAGVSGKRGKTLKVADLQTQMGTLGIDPTLQARFLASQNAQKGTIDKTAFNKALSAEMTKLGNSTSAATVKMQEQVIALQNLQNGTNLHSNQITVYNKQLAATKNKMTELTSAASKTQKVVALVGLAFAASGLVQTINQLKSMKSEMTDAEYKVKAFSGITSGLGMALMAIPFPVTQIIGGIMTLGSVLIEVFNPFERQKKLAEENKKAMEEYAKAIGEANSKLKAFTSIGQDYALAHEAYKRVGAYDKMDDDEKAAYDKVSGYAEQSAPELIKYYDAEGKAVLDLTKSYKSLREERSKTVAQINESMSSRAPQFIEEYTNSIHESEYMLESFSLKANMLRRDIEYLMEAGDIKKAQEKQKELQKLTSQLTEMEKKLSETRANVESNVVQPFLKSDEAIAQLTGGLQKAAKVAFDTEIAFKLMSSAMSSQEAIEKINSQKKAVQEYAISLSVLQDLAKNTPQLQKNLDALANAPDAVLGRMFDLFSTMPRALQSGTETLSDALEQMSKDINKFMAKPVDIATFVGGDEGFKRISEGIKNDRAEVQKQLDGIIDDMSEFNQKYRYGFMGDDTSGFSGWLVDKHGYESGSEDIASADVLSREWQDPSTRNKTLYAINDAKEKGSPSEDVQRIEKMLALYDEWAAKYQVMETQKAAAESELSRLNSEEAAASSRYYELQEKENKLWADRIMQLGETNEGKNMLIGIYNEEHSLLGDLIDSYNEFDSAIDGIMTGAREAVQQFAEEFVSLPDKVKEAMAAVSPEVADALAELQANGGEMTDSIAQKIYAGIEERAQDIGLIYASIMQDDQQYFTHWRETNKDVLEEDYANTGIIAENYATLREYKQAVNDKMQSDYETHLGDTIEAQIDSTRRNLSAMYDQYLGGKDINKLKAEDFETMEIIKTGMLEVQIKEQELRAAQGAYNTAKRMVEGIDKTKILGKLEGAARQYAEEQLAKFEADMELYGGVIDAIKKELASVETATRDRVNAVGGGSGSGTGQNDKDKFLEKWDNSKYDYSKSIGKGKGAGSRNGNLNPYGTTGPGVTKGGSSGSEKTQEDMKVDLDPLHDTNVALKEFGLALDEVKDKLKDAYGAERMKLLQEQKRLLEEQKKIYQQQLTILIQQANTLKTDLSKQGVTFDADGTVTNYNAIIQQKVNAANAIKDPDAKKKAQDAVKEFMNSLKEYEDFRLNIKIEKEKAIDDINNQLRVIFLEEFEHEMKVKLEIIEDKDDIIEFLNTMREEFEDLSEVYDDTMDRLKLSTDKIAEIQAQIEKTKTDSSLTDAERISKLEEYEKELQAAVKNASSLRKELEKINEKVLKDGIDLLDKHVDKFEAIDKQLSHITNMMKLIGEGDNWEAMDAVYEAQEASLRGQLNALLATRESMSEYIAQLEVGSEEWEAANEQLNKMDERIAKITEETLKTFQEELKNTVNGMLDQFDEDMFGGDPDEARRQFERMRDEQEKYLSVQEKIVAVGDLQRKIQEQIDATTDPEARERLQAFMDKELQALKEKDSLTEYDVERAQKLYDITLKQVALDESRANRTIMRLVRDSAGNWSYQYVEDTAKVSEAQSELSDSLAELMDYDKKHLQDVQDEMLDARMEFRKRMQDILEAALNGEYDTQEEFNAAVEQAQAEFNSRMQTLQGENSEAMQNLSESTLAVVLETYATNKEGLGILTAEQERLMKEMGEKVGGKWEEIRGVLGDINDDNFESFRDRFALPAGDAGIALFEGLKTTYGDIKTEWSNSVTDMMGFNGEYETSSLNLVNGVKDAWDEYRKKVEEITSATGTSAEDMASKVGEAVDDIGDLSDATQDVTDKINAEFDAVSDLIEAYQDLHEEYDKVINDSIAFVTQLEAQIAAMKAAANTPSDEPDDSSDEPAPETPATDPAPTTPSRPSPGQSLDKGDKVEILGSTVYTRSSGGSALRLSSSVDRQNAYIQMSSNGRFHVGTSPTYSSATGIGWFNPMDLQSFRTGGYTGDWGSDGKLGVLHEKEIILNQDDTKNILDSVKIVRDYSSMIKSLIGDSSSITAALADRLIQQSVSITAEFPGVKSSFEIEKAFENLGNRAAQYANRRK